MKDRQGSCAWKSSRSRTPKRKFRSFIVIASASFLVLSCFPLVPFPSFLPPFIPLFLPSFLPCSPLLAPSPTQPHRRHHQNQDVIPEETQRSKWYCARYSKSRSRNVWISDSSSCLSEIPQNLLDCCSSCISKRTTPELRGCCLMASSSAKSSKSSCSKTLQSKMPSLRPRSVIVNTSQSGSC